MLRTLHSHKHPHVVVIHHARDRARDVRRYAIGHLAEMWRETGLRVTHVFGPRAFVPADLALVHVDLSVVPEGYLALARRYPMALNARIGDVRKSVLSSQLVREGDEWDGPVIVKTDLNCGGHPERAVRAARGRLFAGIAHALHGRRAYPIRRKLGYRVFDRMEDVPSRLRTHPGLVTERFLPERTQAGYAIRNCCVIGSKTWVDWLAGPHPVVFDYNATQFDVVDAHDDIPGICDAVHLDFGKIDYTIHDGKLVILDVNKTLGASIEGKNPTTQASREIWGSGIYDYLEGRLQPR